MKNTYLIKLAHLTFWAIYLVLYTWIFSHFISVQSSLLRGLLNGMPLFFLVYINIWSINRYFEKGKIAISVLIAILIFTIMIPFRLQINSLFPEAMIVGDLVSDHDSNKIGIIITNLLFLTLSSFYQIIINRIQRERMHIKELQSHQSAQLEYLKAQINPHFLFNTLNNIYSLAVVKSDKTADMVVRLSHLLRYVVYDSQEKQVALDKETNHIQKYIDLFKMRSRPEPNINFNIIGSCDNLKIQPMILIPLVENCCKHCDFDTNNHAFAKITMTVVNNHITFETQNTYNPNAVKDDVGGVGLVNIEKRLELLYGNNQNLKIQENEGLFTINLTIKTND